MTKKSRHTLKNTENKLIVARGPGVGRIGKMGEEEWEAQASSYGMNRSR